MTLSNYETHQFPNPLLPFIFHPRFHLCREEVETNWHKNIEILCCFGGSGYVRCGGEIYDFSENDIIAINSDMLHTIGSRTELEYCCLIVGSTFCADNGLNTENLIFHNVICDPELLALIKTVAKEFENYNSCMLCTVADCRYAVLGVLRKLCRDHCTGKPTNISEISSAHVKRAITYIRTNITKKHSLDDIAAHIGISKFHLCREFKALTGNTIIGFINIIRCSEAKRLIEKGSRVSEAAYACGFDNLSYFSRTFQKVIGYPPSFFTKST